MSHRQIQKEAQAPLAPKIFFKIIQFSGNFEGKSPILSRFWAQGPPPGVKTPLGPLTKILDLALCPECQ